MRPEPRIQLGGLLGFVGYASAAIERYLFTCSLVSLSRLLVIDSWLLVLGYYLPPNIARVLHPREADRINPGIGVLQRVLRGLPKPGHPQHAPAAGHQLALIPGCASVED